MSARAAALRIAADIVHDAIAAGDRAEVMAPVEGEKGRAEVVESRDALYEDPAEWMRERAAREDDEGEAPHLEALALLSIAREDHLPNDFVEAPLIVAEAQVQATLALAAEQRTANLIAYVQLLSNVGLHDGVLEPEQQERHDRAARVVRERLGLDA